METLSQTKIRINQYHRLTGGNMIFLSEYQIENVVLLNVIYFVHGFKV